MSRSFQGSPKKGLSTALKDEACARCPCHSSASEPVLLKKASEPIATAVLGIAVAFVPKCPICWATYLSAFGGAWLARTPHLISLRPAVIGLALVTLLLLLKRAAQKGYVPFFLGLAGVGFLLCGRSLSPQHGWVLLVGTASMVASSLLSNFNLAPVKTSVSLHWPRKGPS